MGTTDPTTRALIYTCRPITGITFSSFLLFFTGLVLPVNAESPALPSDSAIPTLTPSAVASRTSGIFIAASSSDIVSSQSIPSATDGATYASNDNNSQDRDVLNYYFLLLIAFVLFVAVMYWSLARRRHKRLLTSRSGQQSALAQDMERWPADRRGAGRWRFATRGPRVEEGLDERGEAPPPYLKEPEPVHHERQNVDVELHPILGAEGKPPDYDERITHR